MDIFLIITNSVVIIKKFHGAFLYILALGIY